MIPINNKSNKQKNINKYYEKHQFIFCLCIIIDYFNIILFIYSICFKSHLYENTQNYYYSNINYIMILFVYLCILFL